MLSVIEFVVLSFNQVKAIALTILSVLEGFSRLKLLRFLCLPHHLLQRFPNWGP